MNSSPARIPSTPVSFSSIEFSTRFASSKEIAFLKPRRRGRERSVRARRCSRCVFCFRLLVFNRLAIVLNYFHAGGSSRDVSFRVERGEGRRVLFDHSRILKGYFAFRSRTKRGNPLESQIFGRYD